MRKHAFFAVVVASLTLALPVGAGAQTPPPLVDLGNAVVTGFSGALAPDPGQPRPRGKSLADLTVIDPDGAAARILDVARPGAEWNAAVIDAPTRLDLPARTIGQVFGVALDDAPAPNIYLSATSAFGLAIMGRGPDGTPERRKEGGPGTSWMPGQFGLDLSGGPGSIYKVDGVTGQVTLFAEVMLNGAVNPGPALGNLAYDAEHRQLLASDLYTGMVHRFSVEDGRERGAPFDHGAQGRPAGGLSPVAFDPAARPNIVSRRFNAEDPRTWGFAPPTRRVFALAVHDGRLFYSANNGAEAQAPEIWSVGLLRDGGFADDARLELTVPLKPGPYPVTDMVFSQKGAMILAQRAPLAASYDFSAFTRAGEPRVLRYVLETPDDPATPSRWIPEPDEYAVGFAGTFRNANGGVDLGYGYGPDGMLTTAGCEYTLWATGQKLRDDPALRAQLEPGGPLRVDGLQASPAGPVRSFNAPPDTTYFVDYDGRPSDPKASGHMGGVRIRKAPCMPPVAWYGGPLYPYAPPYVVVVTEPPVVGPPPGDCPFGPSFDGTCGYVTGGCPWPLGPHGFCGPGPVDCKIHPNPKFCGLPPVDLTLEKTLSGEPKYDEKAGLWVVTFTLTVTNAGIPFAPGASITLTDPVPAGMTITGAAGPGWTCLPAPPLASGNLNCRLNYGPGLFASGATASQLTVTATVKAPGKYKNCGTTGLWPAAPFLETTLDNNSACAEVEVKPRPLDVAIEKTAKVDKPADGPAGQGAATIGFTLAITNVGPAFTGANVITVTDVVPAGLTFTTVTPPADWTCDPAPIAAGATLTCTYTGTGPAAPGDVLGSIAITATPSGPGKWKNCADAAIAPAAGIDTNPADNTSCTEVEVKPSDLDVAIEKTGKVEKPAEGPAGEGSSTLAYTLAITNVGPAFAGANVITVTDVVPPGLTFTAVTPPADWTCDPAPIAAGSTLTCTYTGTGPAAPGDALGAIAITATTAGKGPWENCGETAVAPAAGTEASLANNKSCVTLNDDGFDKPDDPPEQPKMCGINVIFVVDESGSVGGSAGNVTNALSNAASIFNQNGAQAALIHFSDTAQVVQPMSTSTWGSINTGYSPVGGTNWEAGLAAAASLLPGPAPGTVVVFITDGVPNAALDPSGATVYMDSVAATNEAIPVVNQLYGAGVPVIGIGIGSVSTHLNALLGGNVHMSSFSGLSGTLTSLAKEMCPSLYLTKSISPNSINLHDTPNLDEVTVNLSLTSTAGALTNVVVEDNLPSEMTNPSNLVASSNPASTPPTSAVAGDPVVWTIPQLAAGGTANLAFKVKLAPTGPIPTDGSSYCIRNFAQVTAVGTGVVGAVPNNMANAETGPVHEPDEASARVCIRNYEPPPPQPCTTPYLWVKKSSLNEVCRPGQDSSLPCKFTVTVTAQCTNFQGPVLFGDGMFQGSSSAPLPIASITSSPPLSCAWSSGSPATCAEPNLTLNLGQTITFTVTLAPPIAAGTYRNCFLADGRTPVPTDYSGAYTHVNPGTAAGGGLWGHCTDFVVAEPAPAIAGCQAGQIPGPGKTCVRPPPPPPPPPVLCPAGTTLLRGSCVTGEACAPPRVLTAASRCQCPQGTVERGKECVRVSACPAQQVRLPDGSCGCPRGTRERGGECVKVPACEPPRVATASGDCRCPDGTRERGRECVKVPACQPPRVATPSGDCRCPDGTRERGRECVKVPACQPPRVATSSGDCRCPDGTRERGRECVKVPTCQPPRVATSSGACRCPEGTVERGGRCVKPPPACTRPKVLNAAGICACPAGTEERGGRCVKPAPKPAPLRCIAPAVPNRAGTSCQCPDGYRSTGRACVRLPRKPIPDAPQKRQPQDKPDSSTRRPQ